MDISQASSATGARPPKPTVEKPETVLSSDFETFLRLLTTQLENQDPLNPMESSEFAVQLATFSGVEQQVRTNDLLAGLTARQSAEDVLSAGTWIGKEIRQTGAVGFDGAPVTIYPSLAEGTSVAKLIVRDGNGSIVARDTIPPGATALEWAGVALDGSPLPPGLYELGVEHYAGEEMLGTGEVAHYARVVEVEPGKDGPTLVTSAGARIAPGDVQAVREAAAP